MSADSSQLLVSARLLHHERSPESFLVVASSLKVLLGKALACSKTILIPQISTTTSTPLPTGILPVIVGHVMRHGHVQVRQTVDLAFADVIATGISVRELPALFGEGRNDIPYGEYFKNKGYLHSIFVDGYESGEGEDGYTDRNNWGPRLINDLPPETGGILEMAVVTHGRVLDKFLRRTYHESCFPNAKARLYELSVRIAQNAKAELCLRNNERGIQEKILVETRLLALWVDGTVKLSSDRSRRLLTLLEKTHGHDDVETNTKEQLVAGLQGLKLTLTRLEKSTGAAPSEQSIVPMESNKKRARDEEEEEEKLETARVVPKKHKQNAAEACAIM
ncbi:uncharacterized protein PAC_03271 [Phialocephala subalpina]|uniref:Uncharacterized protein n=1 Tax=Phialocephala subalpina TaxID=576137 RepID=A0A1L7WKY1_9HELO|nr:uncharacterized protein PAC_03271 [Phialocephala subalpina]